MFKDLLLSVANYITLIRIILSVTLLFIPTFSNIFFIIYILTGLTDILDGLVARKLKIVSEFGDKFDTVADLVFVIVCFIKFVPIINIPYYFIIWIIIIALIKFINIILVVIIKNKFLSLHTGLNKMTGLLLFMLPMTLEIVNIKYSGLVVLVVATISAIYECILIRKG